MSRLAVLLNFIAPYRVPVFEALADRVDELRILVSTPMEDNRHWEPHWGDLDVEVQRTVSIRRRWRHPHGFDDVVYVHVPYDTIPRLRAWRPDAVISLELGPRTLQALHHRRRDRPGFVTWTEISDITEQGRGRAREVLRRHILPRSDAVLVLGESGRRYVRRFGVADEDLFVAPCTTDVSTFAQVPVTPPSDRIRIAHVGQLIERKGVVPFSTTLARWAEAHPERLLEVVVAGDGDQRPLLDTLPRPANLVLDLRGNVDYAQVPAIYGSAHLSVFPTLADVWGLVVNEAMAAGTPVLGSTHAQAVTEMIADGVTGWTFRPDDEADTLAALDRALGTPPDQLARMGEAARRRSLEIDPSAVAATMVAAAEHAAHRAASGG